MLGNAAPIYYVSRNLIDQIYRSEFGPLEDKTVKIQEENRKSFLAKLGIGNLAALLSGLTVTGGGEIEKKRARSISAMVNESVEDRALVLIRDIFTNDESLDIHKIVDHDEPSSVYSFSLPMIIRRTKVGGGEGLIEVSHKSEDIEVSGLTSASNWVSQSLTSNLLWKIAKGKGVGVPVGGFLTPVSINKDSKPVSISVQYLIIFHPAMNLGG